ncbi:hypothetical protein EP56_05655 [Listeriaceae bacterium FSL A5-0209]|nr:hypothetical protein EP56_05655 [Listeriaceae bacterium FSL A5-0209]
MMNKCLITVHTKKGTVCQCKTPKTLEELEKDYRTLNAQGHVSLMDDKSLTIIPVKSIDTIRIEKMDGDVR